MNTTRKSHRPNYSYNLTAPEIYGYDTIKEAVAGIGEYHVVASVDVKRNGYHVGSTMLSVC